MQMVTRPTTLGLAMARAAFNASRKVDHQPGALCWPARRVLINLERSGIGVIKVPAWNAHLSFKTARELQQRGVL